VQRQVSLKVKDVMRTRNLISVRRDDDVAMAAQLMAWAGIRHLPVLDAGERDDGDGARVVGVFTERDLLRYRAETGGGGGLDPVGAFMTAPAETIRPDADIAEASARIIAGHLGCLPVIDSDDTLVGIVTTTDLVGLHLSRPLQEPDGMGEQPRVALAMRRNPATVRPYFPLLEAVGIMVDHGVRHVPVTDDGGRVVGIISDSDVRTAIGDPVEALQREWEELEELKVSSVMTTDVVTVREDVGLLDAARAFIDHRIGAIPVLDGAERIVGIVSYVDVLRALRNRVAARG
jgi:CBS-domain-containing membrane protein